MELVNKIDEKELYAARSVADAAGNNIVDTYAQKTEIPDVSNLATKDEISDMATEQWVQDQGYLTEHQSLEGLMAEDKLTIEDGKITKYDGTPFAGQGGAPVSEENLYVATYGVTTYADITTALEAGKVVAVVNCPSGGYGSGTRTAFYAGTNRAGDSHFFFTLDMSWTTGNPTTNGYSCSNTDRWSSVSTYKITLGDLVHQSALNTALAAKQDTLVSGTNIKTVNGESLLGEGNIEIGGGGGGESDIVVFNDSNLPTSTQLDEAIASNKAICVIYEGRNYMFDRQSGTTYYFYGADGWSSYLYSLTYNGTKWSRTQQVLAKQSWVNSQGFATITQVADKQDKLTDVTDIQLVSSLPASPVATVLYLIPEA